MGTDSHRAENGEKRPHTVNQVCPQCSSSLLLIFFYGVVIHTATVLLTTELKNSS